MSGSASQQIEQNQQQQPVFYSTRFPDFQEMEWNCRPDGQPEEWETGWEGR